jgi:tRNA G18 (ribose-2'-O)-methylase SpoU
MTRRADARLSIPMRAGVSSLNLATSVAAVLFAWRLSSAPRAPLS